MIYGSLDTVSGGYLYDRKLLEYFKRQGDTVEIISLPWRNYARHLADNLSLDLYHRLLNLQLDVLLEDELNHPSLFWLNKRLRGKVPYSIIAIVHHLRSSEQRSSWKNFLYGLVEKNYLKTVQGFVFNSQTTQKVVAKTGINLNAMPGVVAHPAGDNFLSRVTEEYIRQRSHEPGPLRIVFVGNVIERKGLHTLLEAIGRLPVGICTLDVIGSLDMETKYARRVQQQTSRLGLTNKVHFHGSLDHSGMEEYIKQSHVLAVPSSYEGFGIVYLEGMSFGLPSIAGTIGAAREIITPEENGYLVDPGDSSELARILQMLYSDRTRLAEMGIAASHHFQAHPNWEETGKVARDFLIRLRSTL
jgi:glycosyltransferase involved in cell wall biosynthesis